MGNHPEERETRNVDVNENEGLLFDPARLPARDDMGYVEHPDLELLLSVRGEDDPVVVEARTLAARGLEAVYVSLLEDASPTGVQAWGRHQDGDGSVAGWEPAPPRPGDRLAAIMDTCYGPTAMFVREHAQVPA